MTNEREARAALRRAHAVRDEIAGDIASLRSSLDRARAYAAGKDAELQKVSALSAKRTDTLAAKIRNWALTGKGSPPDDDDDARKLDRAVADAKAAHDVALRTVADIETDIAAAEARHVEAAAVAREAARAVLIVHTERMAVEILARHDALDAERVIFLQAVNCCHSGDARRLNALPTNIIRALNPQPKLGTMQAAIDTSRWLGVIATLEADADAPIEIAPPAEQQAA